MSDLRHEPRKAEEEEEKKKSRDCARPQTGGKTDNAVRFGPGPVLKSC